MLSSESFGYLKLSSFSAVTIANFQINSAPSGLYLPSRCSRYFKLASFLAVTIAIFFNYPFWSSYPFQNILDYFKVPSFYSRHHRQFLDCLLLSPVTFKIFWILKTIIVFGRHHRQFSDYPFWSSYPFQNIPDYFELPFFSRYHHQFLDCPFWSFDGPLWSFITFKMFQILQTSFIL